MPISRALKTSTGNGDSEMPLKKLGLVKKISCSIFTALKNMATNCSSTINKKL
jgi:hypothetical protein